MYNYLAGVMDALSVVLGFIGLSIAPHFNKFFLSTSLQEFWTRRWNATGSAALRFMVNRACICIML